MKERIKQIGLLRGISIILFIMCFHLTSKIWFDGIDDELGELIPIFYFIPAALSLIIDIVLRTFFFNKNFYKWLEIIFAIILGFVILAGIDWMYLGV